MFYTPPEDKEDTLSKFGGLTINTQTLQYIVY